MLSLIGSLLLGAFVGWIAGKIMKVQNTFWINMVLGLIGGLVGGWIGGLLNISGGWLVSLILAVAGACLILWLYGRIAKKK